jgi:hypothetical protein
MLRKQQCLGHVPADDFSPIVEVLYNGVTRGHRKADRKVTLRDPDRQSTYAFVIRRCGTAKEPPPLVHDLQAAILFPFERFWLGDEDRQALRRTIGPKNPSNPFLGRQGFDYPVKAMTVSSFRTAKARTTFVRKQLHPRQIGR